MQDDFERNIIMTVYCRVGWFESGWKHTKYRILNLVLILILIIIRISQHPNSLQYNQYHPNPIYSLCEGEYTKYPKSAP